MLQAGGTIGDDLVQRDVVDVVARHVAARAEAVDERSRARQPVRRRADVEGRRALPWQREWIQARPGGAVRRRRRLAVSVRRHLARRQQERASPRRVAPGVGHHRPCPLLEDTAVARLTLARIRRAFPVVLVWWWKKLRFGGVVRRRFGDPILQFHRIVSGRVDDAAHRRHRHGERHQPERSLSIHVPGISPPRTFVWPAADHVS